MCEDLVKKIYHIAEKYEVNQIAIMTNHVKIKGTLAKCDKDERSEYIITIKNAKTWLLDNLCKCEGEECTCDTPPICECEWLNVNISKIVAFSVF